MRLRPWVLLPVLALLATLALAVGYDLDREIQFIDETYASWGPYEDEFGPYVAELGGDCGHWPLRALCNASPKLFHLLRRWGKLNPKCNRGGRVYNDGLPELHRAGKALQSYGFKYESWFMGKVQGDFGDIILNSLDLKAAGSRMRHGEDCACRGS